MKINPINPFVLSGLSFLLGFYFLMNKRIFLSIAPLVFGIYKLLHTLGIIRNPEFFRGSFTDGTAYLKDYVGSDNREAFIEASRLIRNFNLKDYKILAIHYDLIKPVENGKQRSSIGIFKRDLGFPDKMPDEFERYCKENGYNQFGLPMSACIYSHWVYYSSYTLMLGIQRFYALLRSQINDETFKRNHKIRDSNLITSCVELYESENRVCFYVPVLNRERFLVYQKDK